MQKTVGRNHLTLRFDDWHEYLETAATAPRVWPIDRQSSQRLDRPWAGTKDFAGAVAIAREGWPEGRAQMISTLDAAVHMPRSAFTTAQSYDVAGAYPDVPRFVSGDPANMINFASVEQRRGRIARVVCNQFVSASCEHHLITNRGAAILSWLDASEQLGHQIELVCLYYEGSGKERDHNFITEIPIKRAGEQLELDRLAFVFAHPSMFRRLHFAIHEQHQELFFHHNGHYGSPNDPGRDDPMRGDIYFPRLSTDNRGLFETMPAAIAHVRAMFEAAGMIETPQGEIDRAA